MLLVLCVCLTVNQHLCTKKEKELATGFVAVFCALSPQTLTYVQYSVPNCEVGVQSLADPKRGVVGVGHLALFPLGQFSD